MITKDSLSRVCAGVHLQRDIYDLGAIRQQARSVGDLPGLYRDNALRAIED